MEPDRLMRMPACLTLPGLDGSGPDHWQTLWEAERPGVERVDLGNWAHPTRNLWLGRLEQALARADGPVILVAHSLSCHLVAWWARLAGEAASRPVAGAMLVSPPDLDAATLLDPRVCDFAPSPRSVLPFPAIVVAGRDDPWCAMPRAREMAGDWLAAFCDAGPIGHINARSGIGDWPAGKIILDRLIDHVLEHGDHRDGGHVAGRRPVALAG